MKILFIYATIKPKFKPILYVPISLAIKTYASCKSLTFPVLAALTPAEHSIELIEGAYDDINYDKKYDLVCISSITPFADVAYDIADEFRKRGVTVVLGGYHPSALPEEAKQHADSIVVGEADESWPLLLKDLENGKLKPFYIIQRPVPSEIIPSPRNDIYPKGAKVIAQATRGCPNGCNFCSITNTKFRNVFRKRPVDAVIEDIKNIPNETFFICDNSMTTNPVFSKQIFEGIKGLGKKFIAYGNICELGKDDEFLRLAREAGCMGWMSGFESVSQESLNCVSKKINKVKDYLSSIERVHDYNMFIIGTFVFGFDNDTRDIFDQTDEFVRKSEIDVPFFHILTPYPGTPLYEQLEREGRILTKDWVRYRTIKNVIFQPKHMTPEELLINTIKLRRKNYSTMRCLKRIIRSINFGYYPFLETTVANINFKISFHPI
jgi:radical SAM superfamily enzyme YgiQ (UPF0313 family)